ncbi:MAG: CoB--CoM heterodisulfide reductase iron-sulfur subunit B family protein [Candidatus Heimdallarchaeota archaeon]
MPKSYSLYLGCYIPTVQPFAELALRKIAPILGIELLDIKGTTCCPVPEIVRLSDEDTWLNVAVRNLSLAESMGKDIMVLCNGCWDTLTEAGEVLHEEPDLKVKINSHLSSFGKEFTGKVEVKHFVEVLVEDVGLDNLKKAIRRSLTELNVAIQYGCKFYKSENEKFIAYFDDIVRALGVKIVDYGVERVCCGYPLTLHSFDMAVEEKSKWKLDKLKEAKVDCVVLVCPACYDQLEKAQFMLRRKGVRYDIPLLHLTELIALALGFTPIEEIALDRHRIRCDPVMKKLG